MAMLVMVGHNTERYIVLDQLVVHFHHGNGWSKACICLPLYTLFLLRVAS